MARRETVRLRSSSLLRELMKAKGFSCRDMADRLPCGKSMVHALTKGDKTTCSAFLGERIAEVVGVPTSVLFAPLVSKNVDVTTKNVAA